MAFGLDLAVHEAVENVVRHGCGDGATHHIRLSLRTDDRQVEVAIVDDAPPFDPRTLPAPAAPQRIEDVVPGGQGVHLMRHFTDEIRYRREGDRKRPHPRARPRGLGPRGRERPRRPWPEAPTSRTWPRSRSTAILRAGRLVRFAPGEVVLRPGEHHRALHFVLEGQLEVRLEEASGTVSRVEPGECFGEMAVIDGPARLGVGGGDERV